MNTEEHGQKLDENSSLFVEFENRAAAIYMGLARRFRDNRDLSWFWLGMSMAERQHAVVLGFCECQQLPGNNASADIASTRDLSELFRDLEKRVAQPDLSVDDAFTIAAELEKCEINAIYDRIVRSTPGTSYLIRKQIETLGANHPHILAKAARKFGASARVFEQLSSDRTKRVASQATDSG
jgi:hypothetical protein